MKLLYGVQGTGNGHISRARMLAKHFSEKNIDVQFLFSGRAADQYFDMEIFGDYQLRDGLSFATNKGSISAIQTLVQTKPLTFIRDVRKLDISSYDAIITDFEPVTAWACRLRKKPVIGIGHQYAFGYPDVPQSGVDLRNRLIMKFFAPTQYRLGLHWDAFNANIAPPIINPAEIRQPCGSPAHIVVYLPFEDQQLVSAALATFPNQKFIQFAPQLPREERANISLRPTSLHDFKHNLCRAKGVICNAGFELISECLHMGIPALAKPVSGQSEQLGNAAALQQLGAATVMYDFSAQHIENWLANIPAQTAAHYPDVAAAICDWLLSGEWHDSSKLVSELWEQTGRPADMIAATG
ncbi:MJ1255/VC2487 family glycosyltransferase [uncultured Zhongshania sp.]|jgi:uncharacterized protein (TIGR00661 family)|uniref:MJ1255/VC2487 family glycosyltransferase n=1 Tax=uncultured Zhongshania sp. TaxID=1642288 RepID=UPI0025EBA240|nr:MJ1255/VC2487 family glycosyltransferase [uncultured Zhongshania sp.]